MKTTDHEPVLCRITQELEERTIGGLHAYLLTEVLPNLEVRGTRALELGAGSGALALQLSRLGFEVLSVDIDAEGFKADLPFVQEDLNDEKFALRFGKNIFDLITAVEVIEHLENPIGFLRSISRMLKPGGMAVVTTPNVENAPARVKFLLKGKLRALDERGEPTHISPIFMDLLRRNYLARAGLKLSRHFVYPPKNYRATRRSYAWAFRLLALLMQGDALFGDIHIFCLKLVANHERISLPLAFS